MRTDVSRETSRLTGMRTAPTSRAGTLRRPRIRIGNPRASPRGGRGSRASRGAPVGEGASRGGGRPPRSARTGSRRHRPQKAGKRGGRECALCTIIGACRRRRGGKHQVGRNGEGEESCIGGAFSSMCRETIRRRALAGTGPILRPSPTRTDVSRETSRLTGMRAVPRAGRRRRTERRGRPGQRTRTQIPRNRAQNANPEELDAGVGSGGAGGRGERRVREREEAGAGARERDRTRRARARAREAERRNSG